MTKFIIFLIIVSSFQCFSKGYGQTVISVNLQNTSLKKAFREIEKRSDYHFLYNDENITNVDKKITLDVNNGTIKNVLNELLTQTEFRYQISDNNTIIIYKKDSDAQAVVIKGKVTDDADQPLPGVTVKVKGTGLGTQTDANGNYSLNVPDADITLVFSYISYDTQEAAVGGRSVINIKLKASTNSLNEVVVVGYGTEKKATLTGAVEQVSSKVFESRAVTNPALALQGETPGLVVTRSSSRPGNEGIGLQIRGATSVNGGTPLIVIDGVPAATSNSFLTMNPDDIESVTVLKDGMAAIYGSRAANGVILVTTKRGKGDIKLDYNANVRFNTVGIKTPTPTMQQYGTIWIDAEKEESVPDYWGWGSLANLQKIQQGYEGIYSTGPLFWNDIFLGQADRFGELFEPRLSQQHTLAVSGSSDKTNYRLSLGYADNRGNLATAYDGQKQYNIRLNYDYKITDWFKLQSGVTYQKDQTSGPSSGLGFDLIAEDPPFFPAKNPYGEWNANFNAGNRNSVASTTDGGRNILGNELFRVDLKADFQLYKDLELEGTGSISSNQYRQDMYNLTVPIYNWDGTLASSNLNPTSNIRAESDNTSYQNYGAYLRYNKTIGDHHITALAGINAEKNDYKGLYAYRTNISSNGVYDLNVADATAQEGRGGQNHYGFYSYLSRVNYSYKDKYLFEALGRRDGSSRFAPGYQFSNFYNLSGGWVITNEDFIKNLHLKTLDFLKVRGSYGVTGNQQGIGLYDYLSTVSTATTIFGSTPTNQPIAILNGLTSNTRTWERVNMKNIGVDLGFLNNRLTATADYYKKENNGMLINVTYPSVLGGAAPTSNSGNLSVHGWEASIAWKDKVGQLTYNLGFNIGDSRNTLVAMEGAATIAAGRNGTVMGYPLNSWFMYQTDGYFKNQAEVDAYYTKYTSVNQGEVPANNATVGLRPGDTKKVDLDGNGYISATGDPTKGDKGDLKFMGDAAPHYIFGINMGAAWKGVDFSAFFQGVGSQLLERDGTLEYPFWAVWANPNVSYIGKTWTTDNPNAQFPRLTVNGTRAAYDYLHNDFMLQNNRYIRLKSLIVGYTLPSKWLERAKIRKLRVFFSGNDLFEFTSIKDGFDPEQSATSTNDGYPFMRTWAFGLNLGF